MIENPDTQHLPDAERDEDADLPADSPETESIADEGEPLGANVA